MSEFSFKLPDLGEGIVESEIVAWHISVGDNIQKDQHIADVQTDKAVIETTSPVAGKVIKLGCQAGETLAVGSELVLIETSSTTTKQSQAINKPQKPPSNQFKNISASEANNDKPVLTSPSVRLKAREQDIDLNKITGSGPKGRITHQDLDAFPIFYTIQPLTNESSTNTSRAFTKY